MRGDSIGAMRRFGPFASLAIVATSVAHAADEPICADRPGKASATCAAPAGHLQIETGLIDWSVERSAGARSAQLVIGATAFKYGIGDRAHVELDLAPFARTTTRAADGRDRASGIGDLLVRYKRRLTTNDAPVAVSLYPFVKLPTANHAIGNGKVEAGLAMPISYAIPDSRLAITLGPELDWLADQDGRGRHAAMVQVVSLGVAATPRLSVSAELWRASDWDPAGTGHQASADASLAFLLSEDSQIDGGGNFGLNRDTPDVELYAGISRRF